MPRDTHLRRVLGDDTYTKLRNTTVLMVGAGGIGCELLKNLVLTGYGEIHIVDLDTVTLSNLNRQFLFRKRDIDASKALTVAKAVESFNYFGCKLHAHHGNIMDTSQFPPQWWQQFSFVFNALDNIEARRYVNKMCLFFKTPLMESGTTGFDGQIQPIYPNYTECFDCRSKETPKTYPVCTIRSTPSQPVHCITWAKEFLFKQLFDGDGSGFHDPNTIQSETSDDMEIEHMNREFNELLDLRALASHSDKFVDELLERIFHGDIERLLRIDSLWRTRQKPVPLAVENHRDDVNSVLDLKQAQDALWANETKVWTVTDNICVLHLSAAALQKRLAGGEASIAFDKDDEDTLNFVSAAANLRSAVFGINMQSKFDIKQIAGNIIPAIATTNAIVSGFSCLYGTRFFQYDVRDGDFSGPARDAATTFISIKPNKYVTSANLVAPNERCPSSSLVARGVLSLGNEAERRTLGWLVESIATKYGYDAQGISIITGKSRLVYDADFDDNWGTLLCNLPGFGVGDIVLVQDEDDVLESLELYVTDAKGDVLPDIKLREKKMLEKEEDKEEEKEEGGEIANESVVMVDLDDEGPSTKKRKVEEVILV